MRRVYSRPPNRKEFENFSEYCRSKCKIFYFFSKSVFFQKILRTSEVEFLQTFQKNADIRSFCRKKEKVFRNNLKNHFSLRSCVGHKESSFADIREKVVAKSPP